MILPSTSDFESPVGAEYHLDPRGRTTGAEQVDLIERQGVITRDAGSLNCAPSLVLLLNDCIRAFRIILEDVSCTAENSGYCS